MYIVEEYVGGEWQTTYEFPDIDAARAYCIFTSRTERPCRIVSDGAIIETYQSEGGLWSRLDEDQDDE